MANCTKYKSLTLPLSSELYDVDIFNTNTQIIDEELHKLEEKNQSQDSLFATKTELNNHVNNKSNPHGVTKSQVGLGNVDNTSDMNKPVSNDQQNAIIDAYNNSISYIDKKIENITPKDLGLGSVKYYIGANNSGNITGDLVDLNVTPNMTLQELFNILPYPSVWEIYFNSQNNELNNGMPVSTGGILHVFRRDSSRGMIYFFDYRNGNIYTTPVIQDNNIDFNWSLIGENDEIKSHIKNNSIHISATDRTNWNDANDKKHIHNNKSVLDGITADLVSKWNSSAGNSSSNIVYMNANGNSGTVAKTQPFQVLSYDPSKIYLYIVLNISSITLSDSKIIKPAGTNNTWNIVIPYNGNTTVTLFGTQNANISNDVYLFNLSFSSNVGNVNLISDVYSHISIGETKLTSVIINSYEISSSMYHYLSVK